MQQREEETESDYASLESLENFEEPSKHSKEPLNFINEKD